MTQKRVLLLCVILLSFSALTWGSEKLQINTSIKPPFSTAAHDGFLDRLLTELFGRIGSEVELIRLPTERALQMAEEGYSDGEVPRISGLSTAYPNLIEVPEPVVDYNFVAFSHQSNATAMGWQALRGKDVGLIIGWKIYENNVPSSARLIRVGAPAQLLHLLAAGRIRYALYERYAGKALIRAARYRGITECQPPLAVRPMYLYLHKSHAGLVKKVATELRRMKQDGSWQKIAAETLEK